MIQIKKISYIYTGMDYKCKNNYFTKKYYEYYITHINIITKLII